jgi:hypothetical protein
MCTPLVRAASLCASIALAALSSLPANAELPRHHKVVTLGPTPSDHDSEAESGFPIFSGFGTAVAIRNGIAFVGIPHGFHADRMWPAQLRPPMQPTSDLRLHVYMRHRRLLRGLLQAESSSVSLRVTAIMPGTL